MPAPAKFAVAVLALRHNEEAKGRWECILVARKDDHNQWGLPGGKLEPNEPPAQGASREFMEETGVVVPVSYLVPHETVLDSDGYFTTFYLLNNAGLDLPDEFDVEDHEAPVRWGSVYDLLWGPYGRENAERLRKIGILP